MSVTRFTYTTAIDGELMVDSEGEFVTYEDYAEVAKMKTVLAAALRSCNHDLKMSLLVVADDRARKIGLELVAEYAALLAMVKP